MLRIYRTTDKKW